jgi:hypothetical protein
MSVHRYHLGEDVPFQHQTWEVDSETTDPLFTSDEELGRFALFRWNKTPSSMNPDTAVWYANRKPPHGSVFIRHLVSGAALTPSQTPGQPDSFAQNATLEFQTCVFRMKDIPNEVHRGDHRLKPSDALACMAWDNKFVWDFKRIKMSRPTGFDAFCDMN